MFNMDSIIIWMYTVGYEIEDYLESIFSKEGSEDKWVV